jgi:hypothetical protein
MLREHILCSSSKLFNLDLILSYFTFKPSHHVSPQLAVEYLLNVPIGGSRLNSLNELIAYPYVKHITGYPDSPDIL